MKLHGALKCVTKKLADNSMAVLFKELFVKGITIRHEVFFMVALFPVDSSADAQIC